VRTLTVVTHDVEIQTLSCNHCMQRAPSLSSKNPTPNWLANKGMYSIIASRTLQCLSSASSTIAGNSDWDSRSIPITCSEDYFHIIIGNEEKIAFWLHVYFELKACWATFLRARRTKRKDKTISCVLAVITALAYLFILVYPSNGNQTKSKE